jgi:hypothetical protein
MTDTHKIKRFFLEIMNNLSVEHRKKTKHNHIVQEKTHTHSWHTLTTINQVSRYFLIVKLESQGLILGVGHTFMPQNQNKWAISIGRTNFHQQHTHTLIYTNVSPENINRQTSYNHSFNWTKKMHKKSPNI